MKDLNMLLSCFREKMPATYIAMRVCERAEPNLLQRGGPGSRGVSLLAEVVTPPPPRGRAWRRNHALIRAAEAGV